MASLGHVAVIVAQDGANTGTPVEALLAMGPTVVMLTQEPGETLSKLSQRVRARVQILLNDGFRVHSATFIAKNGFGLRDVLPTAEMLRSLVTPMVAAGHGRVFLQSDARDARSGYALAALADAIQDQVRGTGVEIIKGAPRVGSPQHAPQASLATPVAVAL
jgi:hypothetical protein